VIRSACLICGCRIPAGTSRCDAHAGQSLKGVSSCVKCGERATSGPYCPTHVPVRPESTRAAYRSGYRDPAYYRERQATLNRARGACEECGERVERLEVDHIVPLRDGGANTRANLRALCVPCHQRKTRSDRRRRRG
jgi:5-methylcytosine-specific restriction protein A